MNRIILIGNGFDLAHGMRTSYNDFIGYYWFKVIADIKLNKGESFENSEIKLTRLPKSVYFSSIIKFEELYKTLSTHGSELKFKNKFLEHINHKKQIQNWVDIENEYYLLLKESFKDENCTYKISHLNSDFTEVQKLLESYLKETENHFKDNFDKSDTDKNLKKSIAYKIYSDFKLRDFTEASINKLAEKKLEVSEMPSHSHGFVSDNNNLADGLRFGANDGYETGLKDQTTEFTGGDMPFSIMNPYRVVHFIEYTGRPKDTTAPTTPTNLWVEHVGSTHVDLAWMPSIDDRVVTNYLVYKNEVLVAIVDDAPFCSVYGLSRSSSYDFYIVAQDAAGNLSDPSNIVRAKTHLF